MAWLRIIWRRFLLLIFWRKPDETAIPQKETKPQEAEQTETEPPTRPSEPPTIEIREPSPVEIPPPSEPEDAPPAPPVEPPPLPPIYVLPKRKEKWVTPKPDKAAPSPVRTVLHKPEPKPWQPPKPKRERIKLTEDPEQWGQYYFRDVILDQLDRYFLYLRRMKYGDRSAYGLLRQVGIQLVPWSATRGFDKWREDSADVELSPWWREHRPGFGAIAYGFDEISLEEDRTVVIEPPDETLVPKEPPERLRFSDGDVRALRPVFLTKSKEKYDKKYGDTMAVWSPRFLYFQKYDTPPTSFERLSGGDTYGMVVYWDRCDKHVNKRWRAKNHGGSPQEYGVFVEHGTGRVRVLRQKIRERIEIKWAKGPYGGKCTEPTVFHNTHWDVPDRFLWWAHRDNPASIEPEDYLRRMFIEAASLYESAVLGSMVRIAVTKGDLTATFGVEIKRMSHFFKDRDVKLTVRGRTRPVFHIVRPYTRKNGTQVRMHFSGLREFEWAGYHVSISVPGLHHLHLPEMSVGLHNIGLNDPVPKGMGNMEQFGKRLADEIKTGWSK